MSSLHNLEAEAGVLGACLRMPGSFETAAEMLSGDDFADGRHRLIWNALVALDASNEPLALTPLLSRLESTRMLDTAGGRDYVASLLDAGVGASGFLAWDCQRVRNVAGVRRLARAAEAVLQRCMAPAAAMDLDALLDDAERLLFEAADRRTVDQPRPVKEVLRSVIKALEERSTGRDAIEAVPMGFCDLDKLLTGLRPATLNVFAARPGVGKTAFAMSAVQHAAAQGHPALVFSIEMGDAQIAERMLSSEASIDAMVWRLGKLQKADWSRLMSAGARLAQVPITIDGSSAPTLFDIRAKARRWRSALKGTKVPLIVIDYLQLIKPRKDLEHREREVAEISRGLKSLAKELGVPLLVLAQLNRESEKGSTRRPRLSDLRESGAIEQDADVVMLLSREELLNTNTHRKGIADLEVAKHRAGPVGSLELAYLAQYVRFADLAQGYRDER